MCPARWSKHASDAPEQAELGAEMSLKSIVQRFTHDRATGWQMSSFSVNCPLMRDFLGKSLENYQDLNPALAFWTFDIPFKPLVHRWKNIQRMHQEMQDSGDEEVELAKKEAVNNLFRFLQPRITPLVHDVFEVKMTGNVAWDMLWQIFPPNELVWTTLGGVQAICRVLACHKESNPGPVPPHWRVRVEFVEWNGSKCGIAIENVAILKYKGHRSIDSLPVYPLSFRPDSNLKKKEAMARGLRFQQLRGCRYMNYEGIMIPITGNHEETTVSGRVMVDAYAYYQVNKMVKPNLKDLGHTDSSSPETSDSESNDDASCPETLATSSDAEPEPAVAARPGYPSRARHRSQELIELSKEHCLLVSPWMIGFDLTQKKWGRFQIDSLSDIEWNDKAFDTLVLPGGEKELAWDFVESKAKSDEGVDDFVPGKGRGIIILMFGPPGVGKTYTAEAVAEKARVPLYVMSAGMLGASPETVESILTRVLELCRLWNAMLLLDEADVFLGARQGNTLAKNELVAIFLTKLEYYQGILFLTTNRFSSIDHAFQSRVDLFLPYRDLDANARKQVWNNFFDHFGRNKFEITGEELDRLSELALNGREIKNLIKSAQLLSARKGSKVVAGLLYMLAENRVAALKMLGDHNAKDM
ncbi:P-loop containing nucleoside triphosphate hydrolase protein [Dichotomopilus funicola]|uniref:P-loop containing nucleoside triphosphate hydrolase protein n=1 Tax=Dichotomopilus funicola TaxID=1934379 RepID=A0AAN6V1N7_9PEZI|nr:P-loop containing nucleoside triphosphate hydrolase protein [Dichotomopilus funicola]